MLVRLKAILDAVRAEDTTKVRSVVRNRPVNDDNHRPALILLDGDEQAKLTADRKSGRQMPMSMQLMRMTPQIVIAMNEQRPNNEDTGTATNDLRDRIIRAIATDAQLAALYGSNGSVLLNATTTDMKSGGAVTGSMLLDFWITYPLTLS